MSARIIDRGRGPEVEGTRVTVYRIMDYLEEESTPERIGAELDLSDEQVQAAIAYIATHRDEVEDEYRRILARVRQANPDWVEAGRATTPEELKSRIRSRRAKEPAHADTGG
jgi:uncharacterized protein (DUF433 family)